MLPLLMSLITSVATMQDQWHPAVDNSLLAHIRKNSNLNIMSTSNGAPVSFCQADTALNQSLIRNTYFMDHITSSVYSRTISRPVYEKGAGAYGYFKVTHDISKFCKASFLNKIGKMTPIVARFSSGIADKGRTELIRIVRGFSVKFYTDEGNFDISGVSTPVFAINNPSYYTKLIYGIIKHPSMYLYNPKALWDLILEHPESLNMFLWVFGDRGIPASYRCMPGHNVHTLQVENKQGETYFMRWHFMPDLGIKYLEAAKAREISAVDPDYYTRDLFDSIKNGDIPSWTVSVQIVTEKDIKRCGYSKIFDITRQLPEKEFPLHPVGKMVLNRNPKNYFAEIEQLAVSPANLVRGILGGPDKVYQARLLAYAVSQLVRLGSDVKEIPINSPNSIPNYNSNAHNERTYDTTNKKGLIQIIEKEAFNRDQCTEYYEELSYDEKTRLIDNLKLSLSVVSEIVLQKVLKLFSTVHFDLARRVAKGFNVTL